MSESRSSKRDSHEMSEKDRLYYNNKTGTSNLIEWSKSVALFMEALFGSKVSPVFREKVLPGYMIGPYVPSSDLPTGNDAVSVEARKLDYQQWFQNKKEFQQDLPKVISVLQTGTMTETSLQRIRDTREAEMEAAIKKHDLLECIEVIWTSHQYRGRAYRVSDQRKIHKEFATFDYVDGETLIALKRRFNELLEKMKNFAVVETDFNKMYQFLLATAKYPNSRVSEQAMKFLGMADDSTVFPKSVNNVYEELISLEEIQAQVRSDTRRDSSRATGSVHVTAGKTKSRVVTQTHQQVLSAHAAVNKSLKKKFEARKENNNNSTARSNNPATQAWLEKEILRTGKSANDLLNSLSPCSYCGKGKHMSSDCRFKGGSNRTSNSSTNSNSNKNSSNRKPSGRFVKKAGVHITNGAREDGEESESELSNWKASVYSIRGRISTATEEEDFDDMPPLIENDDSSDDDDWGRHQNNVRRLNAPFASQIPTNLRPRGYTLPDNFVDSYLPSSMKRTSADTETHKDIRCTSYEHASATHNALYNDDQAYDSMPELVSNSESSSSGHRHSTRCDVTPKKVKFQPQDCESYVKNSESTFNRMTSPPPLESSESEMSISDTDSYCNCRTWINDERKTEPYCIIHTNAITTCSSIGVYVAKAENREDQSSMEDSDEKASPFDNRDRFPFPEDQHRLCLSITNRVMVRFQTADALSSWILARESNLPEVRTRWNTAVTFMIGGLDLLEDEEVGIVFDYVRGSAHRAHGVFLPDEDPDGFHLGPSGEFLERVRVNGWLIAFGVWEFQFTLPTMAQTWAELDYLYRRVFPRHPFFIHDHSWNAYQDLLDQIHDHQIHNSHLNATRHIWQFYDPITQTYTFDPVEWGSPDTRRRLDNRQSPATPANLNTDISRIETDLSTSFELTTELEVEECVGLDQVEKPPDPQVKSGFIRNNEDRGSVNVHKTLEEVDTSASSFDNHNYYCLDSMANVSVFRNPELLSDIHKSNNSLSIDGVGSKVTKVDQVGNHKLFGEVWYLPSNEYNIVSQWQAEKRGFLLKLSEDNKSCYLHRKSDNTLIRFERDPSDHFYKCPAVVTMKDSSHRQVFDTRAQQLHEAYTVQNHSMYYSQEQLRRAEIVEGLHVSMEHPSDTQLAAFIQSPSSINMPISVQDLHNLRAIKGPCSVCLEGRPKPHKGSHASNHPDIEPSQPGELIHSDIVFIQGKPRLFTVDDFTGYMTLTVMDNKTRDELADSYLQVINAYKSYLKVVRHISCDYESVLRSCEHILNGHGVRMSYRIPGEHEKKAERAMRVVRERMRVKRRELPYNLPRKLYDSLAAECIRNINMMPNSKSIPYSPCELVRGEKVNFLTDIAPPFGSLVLCPVSNNEHGTEAKQEVAVALGPAGPSVKSGIKVYIPGKENPVIRRSVQAMAMTQSIIDHMNEWASLRPSDEDGDFSFNDTIQAESQPNESFFLEAHHVSEPVTTTNEDVELPRPSDTSGVTTEIHPPSPHRKEDTDYFNKEFNKLHLDGMKKTMIDHLIRRPSQSPSTEPTQSPTEVPTSSPSEDPPLTPRSKPPRKPRGAPGIDLSNIISDEPGYGTRTRSARASVNQMSLSKSLQSEHSDAAIVAAKKELKQLVDLKTWVYIKNRTEASPSVHTRETPCSMFLKQKFNSRGEFLLWKARLVDGGHRTDPSKYDPFEKTSPTISLEIVMILLTMAVLERLEIESFDVPGAYLNSSLQPGRFHMMRIAKSIAKILIQVDPRAREYVQQDGSVLVEIRRSLYGLPEAAKLWNDYLTAALVNGGYQVCPHDPCLFIRRRGSEISIIGIYVDDCIHIYRGANIYRELYASLRNAKLVDLKIDKLEANGSISFLGLNIIRDNRRNIFINQEGYMTNLLDAFAEPYGLKPKTPLGDDSYKFPMEGEDAESIEVTPFASQLMKVRYVERTRPDVCLALSILQTRMRSPTVLASKRLRRVVSYLESTQDLGITIKPTEMKLYCYCDAGFAVHDQRESQSGILFTLGKFGNPILWKSIKQKLVATSSTEAELICIYDGMDYLLWMRRVLDWLGYPQETTTLYQDNTSTITMAHMGRGSSGSRTKHIDIRYFFIKQFIDAKMVEIDHLGTDHMLGDFFASPRQGQDFRRTRDIIMGYTD